MQRDRDKEARQQVCAPSNEKVVQPTDQTVDTEAGRQRARWAAAIQSQVVRSSNQELTTSQRDTKVLRMIICKVLDDIQLPERKYLRCTWTGAGEWRCVAEKRAN